MSFIIIKRLVYRWFKIYKTINLYLNDDNILKNLPLKLFSTEIILLVSTFEKDYF